MFVPERVVDRIRRNVVITESGCWIWQRSLSFGYGQISWHEDGQPFHAATHRVMYLALVGPVPNGLQLDHLCHDPESCQVTPSSACPHRACCNPAHLSPTTIKNNVLRGGGFAAANAVKTRCPQGHPYDDANTYLAPNGWRQCRTCRAGHIKALLTRRANERK